MRISGSHPHRESRSPVPFLAVAVAIAGIVVAAFALNAERDDPHFVKARDAVRGYEQGKSVEQRNYSKPLYQGALDDLALVDPESISSDPAKVLAEELRLAIAEFQARQQDRHRSVSSAVSRREQQRRAIVESIERERANPQIDYPDCEDEETASHDPSVTSR